MIDDMLILLRAAIYFSSHKAYRSTGKLIPMTSHEIAVNVPQSLDPVYSNMIQIAYKEDEFTFVFLHQIPAVNQARAKAIVSITPMHAKSLLAVLTKTMQDYESKFGKIEPPSGKTPVDSVTTMRGYS
jgi:hypothetical protein